MRLLRSAAMQGDPGPQPLRYASINGRQLFAMASAWPELATGRLTGTYHAVGRERTQIMDAAFEIVTTRGFDSLRPASMIFEHMSLGPPAQLAITLGCRGPFFSFEADPLSGIIALQQAVEDLEEGRCEQALVLSYMLEPPAAWALLLDGEGPLRAAFRYGGGEVAAVEPAYDRDPHGLGALIQALEAATTGSPAIVLARAPGGRQVSVRFETAGAGPT
ncbi:MAG: hypothetical protein FJZ01_22085 [Candidatus Sericytochromatia bacterium]|nr:hypothetical protein [Candidatus Tanganyikabacteria bacterium]